ncbi:MAG: YraN family protein [Lautropia sp.]|nr:YraN family protein [Lautropia sp.]
MQTARRLATLSRAAAARQREAALRRQRGVLAEQRARAHLEAAGLRFVAANVRYKVGEIDLIMADGRTAVFVEVRSRRSLSFGGAAASVVYRKQQRIRLAAQCWLNQRLGQRPWPPCRFDVIAIDNGGLDWIPGAF